MMPSDVRASLARDVSHLRWSRALLWLGAFTPIIITTSRSGADVSGAGIGPLEVVRGGGAAALFMLAYVIMPKPLRSLRFGLVEVALVVYVIVASLSAFWSVDPRSTALKAVPLVFTYLCAMRLPRLYPGTRDVLVAIVGLCHLLMLGTVVQVVVAPGLTYSGDEFSPIARLHSNVPFIASNLLGVVALVTIVAILLKVGPAWTLRKPWAPGLVALYAVELFATRSRIILAVTVVLVVFLLIYLLRRSATTGGVVLLVGAFGVALLWWALGDPVVSATIQDFVRRGQEGQGITSLTGRTVIWARALDVWELYPVLGLGFYAGHRVGLAQNDALFLNYSNLDSTWVESLVNVGLVGTVPLAVFALTAVWRMGSASLDNWHKVAGLAIMSGVLAMSFVNPTIQSPFSTLVIFGVLAFATAPLRPSTIPVDDPAGRPDQ